MKYAPKMNRFEKREMKYARLQKDMGGTGLFVYENNTDGELNLPKKTSSGVAKVGPRQRFQGDSYFKMWVGGNINLLRLVEEIQPEEGRKHLSEEKTMSNSKLILDQPDCITKEGKIERVVVDEKQQKLNDSHNPSQKKPEVLLTEDPLDSVEIIFG